MTAALGGHDRDESAAAILAQTPISRRSLLGSAAMLAAAGVAVSAAGCSRGAPGLEASLPSSVSSGEGDTSRYRSRPDLRPPRVVVDVLGPGRARGLILTDCHAGTGQQGGMIFDDTGELVWYHPVSDHGTPELRLFNLRAQRYHGKRVLCWFEGAVVDGHGEGHYVLADTHYRNVATVTAGNGLMGDLHEFLITEQNTALFSTYGTATADLSAYGGAPSGAYFFGEVQEVDPASGKLLFSWRSDEHVSFEESYVPSPNDPSQAWDYFHLNSINVDPVDQNLIVSSRNTWCVYKVHRRTGEVLWRLGGKASELALDAGARFAYQHDVAPHLGGTLTIFDNAGSPWVDPPSRGLVLLVDEISRTAKLVREYRHHPPVDSPALGSVQDLPDGHVFMGWGTSTYFSEYGPSGKPLLLDGRLRGKGIESYRAFKQPWVAFPAEPPAVAVEPSGTSLDVYASWNGATEVDFWRVLGGAAPQSLSSLGRALRVGFETRISLGERPKFLAVEALDRAGSALARSRTLRT